MATVHSYKKYDITKDRYLFPEDKRTSNGIAAVKGVMIEGTAEQVPDSEIDGQYRYRRRENGTDAPRS